MERHFSRQQLFDLVWSEPIKDVAPQFDISDVTLAKVCKRYDLLLPGRGYWAKRKAGKSVTTPLLPPRGIGIGETITLGRSDWRQREDEDEVLMAEDIPPPPEFPESLQDLIARVAKLVGKVTCCRDLKRPHHVIARLLQEDAARLEKWKAEAYSSIFDQPFFASPYEQRRLRILNGIFVAMARVGMPPSMRGKNPADITVKVGETHITFRLDHPGQQRENWRPASETRRPAS